MPFRVVPSLAATAVAVLLAGCSVAQGDGPAQGAAAPTVRLTAAGDFGTDKEFDDVLRTIAGARSDATLALGDLSYSKPGDEPEWCARVVRHLGVDHPFQLVAGNHESDGGDGFIDAFADCLPNRLPGLVGSYGREWYVDLPAGNPVVRVVMISPDLRFPEGRRDYSAGTRHYEWTARAIRGARTAGIPWVVVGAHKPCLSVGKYDCDLDADLHQLLLDERVDLVLHGHEHHYSRTHQLATGGRCPTVPVDRFEGACLADRDASLAHGAGTVFVTVGTGGIGLRDVDPDDPEWPYFASLSAGNRDPSFGALDLTVTADALRARFLPTAGGFTDAFTISR